MSEGLVYLLFLLAFILITLAIYSIYCAADILKGGKSKINIWKLILIKYRKIKIIQFIIVAVATFIFILGFIGCIAMSTSLYQLDYGMKTAAVIATQNYDDECRCYALCTGEPEIDSKCAYELIFGPDKYAKLVKEMKKDISPGEAEEFDKLTSGKDIGRFIMNHMTQKMVYCYMDDLQISSGVRTTILDKRDNIKRAELSVDELRADLINLLDDYKVLGRNPNCDCKTLSTSDLKDECVGVKHWVKGWSWQAIYESIIGGDPGPDSGDWGYTDDTYVIEIDGKRYFWYHQGSSCLTCQYCGDWSRKYWGGSSWEGANQNNRLANDGCAVYSLAIAVSNQLGRAVTPHELLLTFGCTIDDTTIHTDGSPAFAQHHSGRWISYGGAMQAIKETYGLEYKLISKSVEAIDEALDSGAYVWTQWKGGPSPWYGGDGHFMALRSKDDSNYYRFDPVSTCPMTAGASKQSVVDHINIDYVYAIWNPNPPAWGTGAPPKNSNPEDGGDVSFGSWSTDGITIKADVDRTYNIAFVSDLHMMVDDEVRNDTWYNEHGGYEGRRAEMGNTNAATLKSLVDSLNSQNLDAIVFAGDIIDNYGTKVFEAMKNELNNLKCTNVMWLCADHDYNQNITTGSYAQASEALNYRGGVNLKTITLGSGDSAITLVGQPKTNDYSHINSNKNSLSSAISGKTNVLYFTHVPIESKTNPSAMQQSSISNRGEVYYYSNANSRDAFKLSKISSYADVLYNASNLKGVFAGHVHPTGTMEVEFKSGVPEKVFKAAKDGYIGLIKVVPKDSVTTGGDDNFTYEELYTKLASNKNYSSKATILTIEYFKLKEVYGEAFAIGFMVNTLAEGSPGKIEGLDYSGAYKKNPNNKNLKILNCSCSRSETPTIYYWADSRVPCAAHEISNKTINSVSMVNTMLEIPGAVSGIGVGSSQWSGGRRVGILQYYKDNATTYSVDELSKLDVEYIMKELEGGYKFVADACKGKSVSECGAIICSKYEAPLDSTQPATRGTSAKNLYDYIHSN